MRYEYEAVSRKSERRVLSRQLRLRQRELPSDNERPFDMWNKGRLAYLRRGLWRFVFGSLSCLKSYAHIYQVVAVQTGTCVRLRMVVSPHPGHHIHTDARVVNISARRH